MTSLAHGLIIGAAIIFGGALALGAVTALALCRASARAERLAPSPDSRATPLGIVQSRPYPTTHDWRRP